MEQELLTALLLTATALCAGAALVLSYLHWKAQKPAQGCGPTKANPLDGLLRDRARPAEEWHVMEEVDESSRQVREQAAERFSQLCESIKGLPPKEQASRVDQHFGFFGGSRPAEGRGRKGKRP